MEIAVPRYFFRVEPDGPVDAEGQVLPDDAAAMREAALVVNDMTRNHPGWGGRTLCVYDEGGRRIDECDLIEPPSFVNLRLVK